jgi:hypothetical protein
MVFLLTDSSGGSSAAVQADLLSLAAIAQLEVLTGFVDAYCYIIFSVSLFLGCGVVLVSQLVA